MFIGYLVSYLGKFRSTNFDPEIYAPLYVHLFINTRLLMNQDHEQNIFRFCSKFHKRRYYLSLIMNLRDSEKSDLRNETICTRFSHLAGLKKLHFESTFCDLKVFSIGKKSVGTLKQRFFRDSYQFFI